MKRIFTYLFLTIFALGAKAQLNEPITFETGEALDTAFIMFANGASGVTSVDMIRVLNPYKTEANMSDSVLQFIVHDDADPWVGAYSDFIGNYEFTAGAHTLTMMVYKTIESPVALKTELSLNGGPTTTVTVPNTKIEEWETLSFDFTANIGKTYTRLTFFPDFPSARTGGTTVWIDNIQNAAPVSVKQISGESITIYPNPVANRMSVQYPGMKGLTVSNLLGKTVRTYRFQTTNSKVIELGDLEKGVYFISVESQGGIFTSKFIKN
jgi:hypothetical protein